MIIGTELLVRVLYFSTTSTRGARACASCSSHRARGAPARAVRDEPRKESPKEPTCTRARGAGGASPLHRSYRYYTCASMLLLQLRTLVGALLLMRSCCAANPECRLAAATLPRFKYETFYGWHATNGNFTNVGQSPSAKGLEEFFNATGKPGILELEGVFFTPATKPLRGMVMNPGATAAWKTLAAEIKPLVEKKGATRPACRQCWQQLWPAPFLTPFHVVAVVIIGFMLGDEIVWNGISWQDLNNTALLVKSTFPEPFLYHTPVNKSHYVATHLAAIAMTDVLVGAGTTTKAELPCGAITTSITRRLSIHTYQMP